MARATALLIPNPHTGLELGVPIDLRLDDAGAPPPSLEYDGNHYVLGSGRGAAGEWVYEHLD